MANSTLAIAEAQINLSDALFRVWIQPLHLAQATLAAGAELIAGIGEAPSESLVTPVVFQDAEEKLGHLDEEIDRAVPGPAAIVV